MKIGIVTLPLINNYGGVLQNYALQRVLLGFGHQVVTFDCDRKKTPLWMYLCSWLKSFLFLFIPGKRRPFAKISFAKERHPIFESFIEKNIYKTRKIPSFSCLKNKIDDFDVLVVGSDQIWRPKYAPNIEDAFLAFVKNDHVRRICYAVSFGVDRWEFSPRQTEKCGFLAKKFDAISVREKTGIDLCRNYLGVDSTCVLDPTLLLKKTDYEMLCDDVPVEKDLFLAAYVLGETDEIKILCDNIAKEKKLKVRWFSADKMASISIPEWISMFRDASYVVTDSFHGTVFSIIFDKEFKCVFNESRGSARFESLLELYNTGKLDEMRDFSLNWLKNALES